MNWQQPTRNIRNLFSFVRGRFRRKHSASPQSTQGVTNNDWFSCHASRWQKLFAPIKDKPNVQYLEVGVYEGESAFWMLDNILTHPTSHMSLVDPFYPEYESRFLSKLDQHPRQKNVTVVKGFSHIELRRFPLNKFDIIYLDGSHDAPAVYRDAALSWDLLKEGGILIFDDYPWEKHKLPLTWRPQEAIDSFLISFGEELEVISFGWQIIVRKGRSHYPISSHFGKFAYDWLNDCVVDSQTREQVPTRFLTRFAIRKYFLRLSRKRYLKWKTHGHQQQSALTQKVQTDLFNSN